MKYLITILLFIISLSSFSQVKVGSDSKLAATGAYGVTDIDRITGYSFSVADITARNAIPDYLRKIGMRILVRSDTVEYVLVGGILDANWRPYTKQTAAGTQLVNRDTTITGTHITQITFPHLQGGNLTTTPSIQVDNSAATGFEITSDNVNVYLKYPRGWSGTTNIHMTITK